MVKVFDSQCELYKTPIGPLKEQEQLKLAVNLESVNGASNVMCVLTRLGSMPVNIEVPMEANSNNLNVFETQICLNEPATYQYYFKFHAEGKEYFLRKKRGSFEAEICDKYEFDSWMLTVYKPITTNPIMHSGIMYQVFPDRFAKDEERSQDSYPQDRLYRDWGEMPYSDEERVAKDFFKGSFNGAKSKIPYWKKLHVSAVYFNPIWLSSSNHRYDAIDYKQVDPVLGTLEEFKAFVDELHKNGMIFILDAVMNHVGSDSIYFDVENEHGTDGAYTSQDSSRRDWFYFDEEDPTKYACWWNVKTMPKLNYSSHGLVDEIFGKNGVIPTWFKYGVDGLRLDVADELPNEILRDIFNVSNVYRGDNKIIIPEVWEDASIKYAYGHLMEYVLGNQATSVMNYPIRDTLLPYVRYGDIWAYNFKTVCEEIFLENYPREIAYSLMNFLSTHDTVRAITKLAGPEADDHDRPWQEEHNFLTEEQYFIGRERLKIAYAIIFMLPGIPSIYYGDEIGMQGMKDPFNRQCMDWDNPDTELLHFFEGLCQFRYDNGDFLSKANFKIVTCEDRYLVMERYEEKRTLRLIVNTSKYDRNISEELVSKKAKIVFKSNDENENVLKPRSCVVIEF